MKPATLLETWKTLLTVLLEHIYTPFVVSAPSVEFHKDSVFFHNLLSFREQGAGSREERAGSGSREQRLTL